MSEQLARRFHEAYERLAPLFGYETRTETRAFDPESANGKLMIAVCAEVFAPPPPPVILNNDPCRSLFDDWAYELGLCLDELFMSADGVPENPFEDGDTKHFYAAWLASWKAQAALRAQQAAPYCTCPHDYPMHLGHHPDCNSQIVEPVAKPKCVHGSPAIPSQLTWFCSCDHKSRQEHDAAQVKSAATPKDKQ